MASLEVFTTIDVYLMRGDDNAVGFGSAASLSTSYGPNAVNLKNTQADGRLNYSVDDGGGVDTSGGFIAMGPKDGSSGTHGAELTLARDLSDAGRRVAVFKDAKAGSSLLDWVNTQNTAADSRVVTELASLTIRYRIAGIIAGEGATDANDTALASAYQGRMTTLISRWRSTWGSDVPIFIPTLSSSSTHTFKSTVEAAKTTLAGSIAGVFLVSSGALAVNGSNRLTSTAAVTRGQQLAATSIANPPAEFGGALAPLTGSVRIVFEGDSRTNSHNLDKDTFRKKVREILLANVGTRLPSDMTFSFIGPINTAGADANTSHHAGVGGSKVEGHYDPSTTPATGYATTSFGPGKSHNCELLCLMIGINNCSTDPLLATAQSVYPQLLSFLQDAIGSVVPGVRFVVVKNYGESGSADARRITLNSFFTTAWDNAAAAGMHLTRVDFSAVNPTDFPSYYDDGLHLTSAGNESTEIATAYAEGLMVAMGY